MDGDKKFLVEKLAEYAERNRFTSEELARLIRLSLQLERDCPGVQFVIPEGNAGRVERALQRQAQISKRTGTPQKPLREKSGQTWT